MYIVGLTGPTGSGKSTAAREAQGLGFYHIDADFIARRCTEKGSPLLSSIEEAFPGVTENGQLIRSNLASQAFSSPENTEKMNEIMLPYILEKIREEIANCGSSLVLLDAPTLFESGADNLCDSTVAVLSPEKIRLERIIARDKISREAALLRIGAGKSDNFYLERCQHILINDSSAAEFSFRARELFSSILEGAKG